MIFKFINNENILTLPKDALLSKLPTASEIELKVLLYASALGDKESFDENDIQKISNLDLTDIIIALQFWRGAEVLTLADSTDNKTSSTKQSKTAKKLDLEHDVPIYSGEELAAIMEKNPDLNLLIDECQKLTGKSLFNPHERNKIVALHDYLGLSAEYILSVFNYCKRAYGYGTRTTIPYIVKTIYSIYDKGIDTEEKLYEYLKFREEYDSYEGKVLRIFGIQRKPSAKEEAVIENWMKTYAMTMDMVEYAYEITVNATNKASIPYANKIMLNWHKAGCTTLEQAKELEFNYKKKQEQVAASQSSFDTDEFFEAALKHSYEKIQKLSDEQNKQ